MNNNIQSSEGGIGGFSKHRKSLPEGHRDRSSEANVGDYVDAEFIPISQKDNGFSQYLNIVLRRKKTVLIVLALAITSSIAYTLLVHPIYRSVATLEIEKETGTSLTSLGESLTQGLTGPSENEVFATQIGIIKDRTMADGLIKKLNLTESAEFNKAPGWLSSMISYVKDVACEVLGIDTASGVPSPEQRNEAFINKVQERILAKRDGQSRLINVSFDAGAPETAQVMLKNLIDIYLSKNLEKRRRVQREGNAWLDGEIEKAEKKVVQSLASMISFSEKHGMVAVEEGANHILAFFQRSAENLIKTKEQRIGIEAFQRNGSSAHTAAAVSGVKTSDLEQMQGKLSLLEAEHAQMMEIYSENYPKAVLLKKQIAFLRDKIEESQTKAVDSIVKTAREQERLSESAFEDAKRLAMDNKSSSVQFAVLKKEAQTNEEIYSLLLKKSKELQLSTEIIGNNILTVVNPTLPIKPVFPKGSLNLALGTVLGLVMGLGAAFLRERLDTSVQDVEELERAKMTVLGTVPNYTQIRKLEGNIGTDSKNLPVELAPLSDPTSAFSDSLSIIRTSLLLTTLYSEVRTVLITSAVPNEGKSFISVALSGVLAAYGKRVLIVEGDFRKPRLSTLFKKGTNSSGLSTLLVSPKNNIEKSIQKLSVPNLFLMGAGPTPKDPARLLGSENMNQLLRQLRGMFDLVLIDAPPVEGMPDSRILSSLVDGIVFVVRQGHAPVSVVRSAHSTLCRCKKGVMLGTIFNNVQVFESGYLGYLGYGSSGYTSSSYYRREPHRSFMENFFRKTV